MFKQWYMTRYGVDLSKKKKGAEKEKAEIVGSRHALALKVPSDTLNFKPCKTTDAAIFFKCFSINWLPMSTTPLFGN